MPDALLKISLVGGPTAIIEYGGLRFLTDPTFDHAGSCHSHNQVKLTKTSDAAIDAASVGPIDAVLLSHDHHFDNLDTSGRAYLDRVPRVLTTVAGAGRLAKPQVQGLKDWESVVISGASGHKVRVTATPCRHGPAGIEPIAGDVVGFILEADGEDGASVYVTGDTVYYEGVAEVARRFAPSHILAFAGAAQPRGPINLTMSNDDLLDTARAFPNALIVPIHAEGWAHFTQPPEQAAGVFAALGLADRIRLIGRGETLEFA